ncbi:chemotaxis protein CheW [Waterburya agarophytonicola K14]|uniref:Chemotaxis protein CheW n=1 Tax=Waterburya agarophytonicola KI4 TaxID=2874699 RepID=A0A964BNS9_9CYAN|nr:chemotaxis protein CheW [Waterburya agarophytonicola]MCC0176655.1 chemotaxis protein CheW [Waterburya agarophytonicola KI4]
MNNLTADINSRLILESKKTSINIKLLVFDIGKLTLALPILQVQKVIKYNPLHGSGLSYVNLTHFDNRDVAIVDLHQKLFKISLAEVSSNQGYFIITKNINTEPLGIFVSEAPALIDVATTKIRLIPDSYRHADTLEIASHVTAIEGENNINKTIFILDLTRLI